MDTGKKKIYILPVQHWATVAQLVEHLTRNEDVCGSTPHGGSINISNLPPSLFISNWKCLQIVSISFKNSRIKPFC